MPKHKRIRAYLPNLLDGNELNTRQVMDVLEAKWPKTCPSINAVGNLLSRHKEIEQVGFYSDKQDGFTVRTRTAIWSKIQE